MWQSLEKISIKNYYLFYYNEIEGQFFLRKSHSRVKTQGVNGFCFIVIKKEDFYKILYEIDKSATPIENEEESITPKQSMDVLKDTSIKDLVNKLMVEVQETVRVIIKPRKNNKPQ